MQYINKFQTPILLKNNSFCFILDIKKIKFVTDVY